MQGGNGLSKSRKSAIRRIGIYQRCLPGALDPAHTQEEGRQWYSGAQFSRMALSMGTNAIKHKRDAVL